MILFSKPYRYVKNNIGLQKEQNKTCNELSHRNKIRLYIIGKGFWKFPLRYGKWRRHPFLYPNSWRMTISELFPIFTKGRTLYTGHKKYYMVENNKSYFQPVFAWFHAVFQFFWHFQFFFMKFHSHAWRKEMQFCLSFSLHPIMFVAPCLFTQSMFLQSLSFIMFNIVKSANINFMKSWRFSLII